MKFHEFALRDSRPILDRFTLPPAKVIEVLQDADARLDPLKQVNLVRGGGSCGIGDSLKTVKVINVFG